ncbi:MAG: LD-carboxypeptidase [Alphaproteobacteria bacterium]|jgi:muramoyltetrapeptide carboxypeptidase|nr:LD-carboxypeptidase [Alphaproteobacteria bacterium]
MIPSPLRPGDTIGVMAPSSYVEKKDIEKSKALLEKKGYKVFIHPQTYERENQSAGTHLQKTLALQGLWQRPDITAIWAAGGGNRAMHLLDSINFEAMKRKPKILIGFSDVTALLNAVTVHTGIPTVHGPVFKNLSGYKQLDHLLDLLAGKKISYPWNKIKVLSPGKAEGPLIGGNLSIFQYLPKTLPGEFWKDSLLFLEDCGEELSRVDRMLLHLRRSGILKDVSGIIMGQFTDSKDTGRPFGFTLEEIIREHTESLGVPVVMNAPFGHGKELYAFPVGVKAALDTQKKTLKLSGTLSHK